MGILQNETRIEPFMDAIFSFLHRKTDFFRTLTEESKVGFPPGVAENMLRCYYMKYNMMTKEAESAQAAAPPTEKPKAEKAKVESKKSPLPPPPRATTQDEWQKEGESHNGAVRDNYSWTQTFDDVDVTVPTTSNSSRMVIMKNCTRGTMNDVSRLKLTQRKKRSKSKSGTMLFWKMNCNMK